MRFACCGKVAVSAALFGLVEALKPEPLKPIVRFASSIGSLCLPIVPTCGQPWYLRGRQKRAARIKERATMFAG
jgi:hypothetical protein